MKNFCSICCKSDENCVDKCSSTHSFFKGHDPEEMFISVCANENMGPAFKNFCGSMIVDDNKQEFDQCFTNFCFDCCSNELKISDFNDVEIQKCLKICKEGKNKLINNAKKESINQVPLKKSAAKNGNNVKPIELSDEIKQILEKPVEGKEEVQSSDDILKDLNKNTRLKNKKNKAKQIKNDETKLKELIKDNQKLDNNLKSIKSSNTPSTTNTPSQQTKKIQVLLDKNLTRKQSTI